MKNVLIALLMIVSFSASAWEGYDWDKGNYVEITEGSDVSEGDIIEIYDYEYGDYRQVEVTDVTETSGGVEVEIYDRDLGEMRYLDMEKE